MKITYFVHGTTTDNEQGIATGCLPGKLSELGIQQAKDLPKQVSDTSFSLIVTSDLKRAIDSAELGFAKTHKIIQDKRIREADYGELNGGSHTFKDRMTEYVDNPFPGGECYKDVEKRMRDLLEDLKSRHVDHVSFVAHEAPQLALEVICNGLSWEEAINTNWRKHKKWQPGWTYVA